MAKSVNVFDQFDDPTPKAAPAAAAAPAGPNAFDQFDEKPAAPTVAPAAAPTAAGDPPRTMMGRIIDAIHPIVSGINSGAADVAGLPMSAATNVTNLGKSGIEAALLKGGVTPPTWLDPNDPSKVPGTPEWLKAQSEKVVPGSMNDAAHPILHGAAELVGPGGAAALATHAAESLPAVAESIIGKPTDADPLATARAAGFKTSASNVALRNPTQQPGILNQVGEVASGGNSAITRANQADNTAQATKLAGQQMGLGDNVTKITVPDLKTAKAAPGAAYDLTGQALGDFTPTSNLTNLLKDAAADQSVQATGASRQAASKILSSIAANDGKYAGSGIVGDISKLRESANTRPIANMLEDEMGRQAQNSLSPTLLKNYQDARRQFAQIFTVQDALQGGQVDPQAIGAVHQANPNLLTGGLRLIGSAAQELPADMQLPTQSKDGALDAILDKTKGVLGSIVRPLMRSDTVQNQFGPRANAGGASYFPTFGEKPEAAADPLKLALSPGSAGRIMPSEGGPHGAQVEAAVPQNPRPLIDLAQPEGQVGRLTPVQGGLSVPEGPESISGAVPSSRGANDLIRPLGEAFQPHQPDLFPPQNVRPGPKGKLSPEAEKLLRTLGLGE